MRDRKSLTHNAWMKNAYALCVAQNTLRIMRDEKIFCYAYGGGSEFGYAFLPSGLMICDEFK
jgi:hypothetical protein